MFGPLLGLLWLALIGLWLSGWYLLGWHGVWENSDHDGLGHSRWEIEISGGGICLSEFRMRVAPNEPFAAIYQSLPLDPLERTWGRGVSNDYPSRWGSDGARWALRWNTSLEPPWLVTRRAFIFPGWTLLVAGAVWVGIWLKFHRKPQTGGHCATCGYDVRANSHRCPECGSPIPTRIDA